MQSPSQEGNPPQRPGAARRGGGAAGPVTCKGGVRCPRKGGREVRAGIGGGHVCGGERPYSRSWTCIHCARRKKKPGEISGISHSDEMRDLPCD